MKRFFLLISALLLFSSCSIQDGDGLMRAPKPPIVYEELRGPLQAVMGDGYEYAMTSSGDNRESTQTVNLTGAGSGEALVILRSKATSFLSVHIFTKESGEFVYAGAIENNCSAIDSIAYADLMGEGGLDIVIAWRESGLRSLTVHSIDEGEPVPLLQSTEISEFCLLPKSEITELMLFTQNSALGSAAELYSLNGNLLMPISSAPLSSTIGELKQVYTGALSDGSDAVFVTSSYQSTNFVTDVITYGGGSLSNITLNKDSGISDTTVSKIEEYPSNVEFPSDRVPVVGVPVAEFLPAYDPMDEEYADNPIYKLIWKSFDSAGQESIAAETYRSLTGSWRLYLPEEWRGRITVSRPDVPDRRFVNVTFALWSDDSPPVDIVTLRTIQKTSNMTNIDRTGMFSLFSNTNIEVLAALIPGAPDIGGFELTKEELLSRVKPIAPKWK